HTPRSANGDAVVLVLHAEQVAGPLLEDGGRLLALGCHQLALRARPWRPLVGFLVSGCALGASGLAGAAADLCGAAMVSSGAVHPKPARTVATSAPLASAYWATGSASSAQPAAACNAVQACNSSTVAPSF